jgi:hypothetical protein
MRHAYYFAILVSLLPFCITSCEKPLIELNPVRVSPISQVSPTLVYPIYYPYPPWTVTIEPYPYPQPSVTVWQPPTQAATNTPSSRPTVTPSPSPTITFLPYSGQPFSVVCLRDNNLWLIKAGGDEERQLTFEPKGWNIYYYDISP